MQNSMINLTDTASQIAELQRRQKLAEALAEQAGQPIEVQSYNGIQAPISPFSVLAKVLDSYTSKKQMADAIKGDKEARKTERDQATSYFENLGKTPDIGRFETPVSVEEARQQAAVPALTPVAPAGPPEMMQVGGVPTDMQGGMTPAASMQAPVPQVYSNAQPSAYAGPQATVTPGRETTPQERMASLLQAGMSGNRILEQMAPAMYGKIEGQIEAQGKADRLKAQIAGMTGLTDEQKSAYAQMVDVNPQAAGNFLKDVLTPKEPKPAEYGQMRAAAVERIQRGEPPMPGDNVLLYGARGGAPARASVGRATGRAQGLGQAASKPNAKTTQSEKQGGFLAKTILNSANTISDIIKNDPSAGNVGFLEAAGSSVPFVGEGLGSIAQSGNRQVVSSAQDEIIDAALTLATGAAYTKEQMKQKRNFYKPSITDKLEQKEAKIQRINQLIQSAKTRAGSTWTPEMDTAVSNLFKPAPTASAKSAKTPAGIDQKTWNAMTPEERKLF